MFVSFTAAKSGSEKKGGKPSHLRNLVRWHGFVDDVAVRFSHRLHLSSLHNPRCSPLPFSFLLSGGLVGSPLIPNITGCDFVDFYCISRSSLVFHCASAMNFETSVGRRGQWRKSNVISCCGLDSLFFEQLLVASAVRLELKSCQDCCVSCSA